MWSRRAPALVRGLRSAPFAALWVGQVISRFGDTVTTIAVAWLVLQLTGSATAMGVVLTANVLAFLVFSLAGGVLVDRLGRLSVMLASDLLRLVLTGGVAILIATDQMDLAVVVAFSGLFGAVEAFFYPAYTAAVPELVPPDDRPSANSLQQLGRRLASLVGPALGATLVATGGTASAFALDAATFGASAALIVVALRLTRATAPVVRDVPASSQPLAAASIGPDADLTALPPRQSPMADLREGLRTVTGEPWLWITILLAGVTGITLVGPLQAGLPLLVSRGLHSGVEVLGLIQSMVAVGAIGAALVVGSRARLRRRGLLVYVAWIGFALGIATIGLPIGVAGVALTALFAGACAATLGLTWTNTLQDLVPPDRLGRVASIDALGSSALEPVGFVAAGIAADAVGPAAVFVGGGLASAVILGLALTQRSIRDLD